MISLLALGKRPPLPGREAMPSRDTAAWRALASDVEPAPGACLPVSTPGMASPQPAAGGLAADHDDPADAPQAVAPEAAPVPTLTGPGPVRPAATPAQAAKPAAPALKASQLAQRSTHDMAQRARRHDEVPDSLAAPLPAPALMAAPATPSAHAAPPMPPAEMLLAAVERLLVAEPDRDGQQRVHLTLSADWFGETALTLTREADGWHLDIATASPRIADSLRGASAELAGRFAARGLGRLNSEIRTTPLWDILEEPAR